MTTRQPPAAPQPVPSASDFMRAVPAPTGSNTAFGQRYGQEIKALITHTASQAPRSLQSHLGPSELGARCSRQVVGKMAGIPATNHVASPWPSIVGTSVHAWLAEALDRDNRRCGYKRWITEMAVTPIPGHSGHTDAYDSLECLVGDWKILGESSLAKIRSGHPPLKYLVQILLYALGVISAGYPVKRVAIIALPRTSSTLSGAYVWEHPFGGPEDIELLQWVVRVTAIRTQLAERVREGVMPIEAVPITPDDSDCYFCVGGETEVITRTGIKSIADLAGDAHELLVPDAGPGGSPSTRGDFRKAEVRSFGQQHLWKIRLRNHSAVKDIYATAEHRWIRADRVGRPLRNYVRTTAQLQPGDRLRSLRAHSPVDQGLAQIPDAIARGFVYGDGCVPAKQSKARVNFYDRSNGKFDALMPFFPNYRERVRVYSTASGDTTRMIQNLPPDGKQFPDLNLSRDFLLSWLAGYFAADGNVSSEGQVTLSSSREDNLQFAQAVAAICGVGYGTICSRSRLGFGTVPTPLYALTLRRRDLPDWFFIRPQHLSNARRASEDPSREVYWSVESVAQTDRFEEVFCAVVPGIEAFGLAGDLMTSNCPYYRPQSAYDGGSGCPGTIGNRDLLGS